MRDALEMILREGSCRNLIHIVFRHLPGEKEEYIKNLIIEDYPISRPRFELGASRLYVYCNTLLGCNQMKYLLP
jgi:hypothetical protein